MKKILLTATLSLSSLMMTASVQAGEYLEEFFIGQVITTAANYCPKHTIELNGQLLSISDNMAVFTLLGTMYGGDGRTTFAVPDMRGRSPVHTGTGPGLAKIGQGQYGGKQSLASGTSGQKLTNNTAAQGGSQSAAPSNPYLALRMCMVTRGIFPPRG